MGGKKHGNRTKGNTRPSSSGRCAERLSNSGAPVAEIFGFGLLHGNLSAAKASEIEELADFEIDGDCRMILKKMTKRDQTTRLKAVQEFKGICVNRGPEDLNKILPFWPRLYNKLSLDHDRRVREATHEAHRELVSRVKKNLAPHLKLIMGNWLLAQCDPYSPSASAAKSSFESAFATAKQQEALAFCAREVLSFIKDNMCKHTPQTLSDAELASEEEMEEKYGRIVASSMDALGLFVTMVGAAEQEKWQDLYEEIVSEPKFWKYAKSQNNLVKAAWYRLVCSFCKAVPALLSGKFAAKLCPLTLGCLDESDPVVAPIVWEAALFTVATVVNCWENVNISKAMLPSLWVTLREGGHGSAAAIYPNLLPLMNSIPKSSLLQLPKFYTDFFNNCRQGMLQSSVKMSSSEQTAIITAFMECWKYALIDVVNLQSYPEFLDYLITEQLLVLIESSLVEWKSVSVTITLYRLLRDALSHIHNQDNTAYCNIAATFWTGFGTLCRNVTLDTVDENGASVLANLAVLFSCISAKEDRVKRGPKSSRVRFAEVDCEKVVKVQEEDLTLTTPVMAKHVVDVALDVCEIGMRRVCEEGCVHHMEFLPKMMSMFASPELFSRLLKSTGREVDVEDVDAAPANFFKEVTVNWVSGDFGEKCTQRQRIDFTSGATIAVLSCVDSEVQLQILTEICMLKNVFFLEDTIAKLFGCDPEDPLLLRWFKISDLGNFTVDLAREMTDVSVPISHADQWASSLRLLNLCFKTNSRSEAHLDIEYIRQIFGVFCTSLSSWNDEEAVSGDFFGRSVDFVCDLASGFFVNVKNCWQIAASEELLLALFVQTFHSNFFTTDTLRKLTASWKSGVSSLVQDRGVVVSDRNGFFYKSTSAVHHFMIDHLLNKFSLQRVSEAASDLLIIIYNSLPSSSSRNKTILSNPTLRELLAIMLAAEPEWKDMRDDLDNQWMCGQLLDGLVLHETSTLSLSQKSSDGSIQHISFAYFTTKVIQSVMDCSYEDETGSRFLFPHLLEIFHARKYCHVLREIEAKHVAIDVIALVDCGLEILDGFCGKVLTKFSSAQVSSFLSEAITRSFECGYLWAIVVRDLVREIMQDSDTNMSQLMMTKPIDSVEAVHTMQSFVKVLDPELVQRLLEDAVNSIDSSTTVDFTNSVVPLALAVPCLHQLPLTEETSRIIVSLLDALSDWKTQYPAVFFQSWENEVSADSISFNVQVMKIMNLAVVKFHQNLLEKHWDFVLCSLGSWIRICCDNISSWKSQSELFDVVSVACDLLSSVATHMDTRSKLGEASEMISEWAEFFAEQMYNPLLPLFVTLAAALDNRRVNLAQELILQNIANGLQWILESQIENNKLAPKFSPDLDDEEPNLPDEYKILINHLQPLLISNVKAVQICAFRILSKVVWKFPNFGAEQESADDQEDNRPITASLRFGLIKTIGLVEELLAEFKIGDCCVVQPYTASYSSTQSYLLWWHLILDYFQAASPRHRSQYAAYLRDSGLATALCENLFKLMPANVTVAKVTTPSSPKKTANIPTLFSEPPNMFPKARSCSDDIGHLACTIYYKTVKYMPALVREWWKSLDKRSSIIVDKFTAKHVSVLLCLQEMKSVQQSDKRFQNMQVKARPVTREVIATYTIDDISIELVIMLAENHPLAPVSVETGKRIGVSSQQWGYWTLQLITFLSHQNGSILDGLALWKKNIDKKFEGVTECHICFYILHATTSQLPRLQCRTCKKKFHNACLYKWFSTSNNATCPLCRTVF